MVKEEDGGSGIGNKRAAPSPGGSDNPRKRQYGQGQPTGELEIKIMIPQQVIGSIIGKGGETMKKIQSESQCHLRMSKGDQNYPGTAERLCYVKGTVQGCCEGVKLINEKLREKYNNNAAPPDPFDVRNTERTKEVKIVVPNTSAGFVIGKSGANIKEIKENTGAVIIINPKVGTSEAQQCPERVITIAANNPEDMERAMQQVFERVSGDPNHGVHASDLTPGMSLAVVQSINSGGGGGDMGPPGGPPSGPFPLRSLPNQGIPPFPDGPGRTSGPGPWSRHGPPGGPPGPLPPSGPLDNYGPPHRSANIPQLPVSLGGSVADGFRSGSDLGPSPLKGANAAPLGGGSAVKFNPMEGVGNMEVLQFLDSLQHTLRSSGFTEAAVAEIMQAMQVLAKYNIMGLGLGLGVAAMAQLKSDHATIKPPKDQQSFRDQQTDYNNAPIFGGAASGGGNQPPPVQQPPDYYTTSKTSSFAASVINERPQAFPDRLELEIPEAIVGIVFEQNTRNAEDIRHFSGASMEIDKRTHFVSGKPYRLIILSGGQDAIRAAKVMVERAINDEHSRRQQQQQQQQR